MSQRLVIGIMQLAAWEKFCKNWPLYRLDNDPMMRCAHCDMGIWRVFDDDRDFYQYTETQQLALIVGHARNVHRDMETQVYEDREDVIK